MDKGKAHILLVEDDVFLSNIYQKKFEMEGFKISTADNGEKGLARKFVGCIQESFHLPRGAVASSSTDLLKVCSSSTQAI
jgi:hypothetical protein